MAVKLDEAESLVLKMCCEKAVETDNLHMVDSHAILSQAHSLDMTDKQVFDTLELLFQHSYVKPLTLSDGHIRYFEVTFDCFDAYATVHLLNYQELIQRVAYEVVNDGLKECKAIATTLKQPPVTVEHCLAVLQKMGLLRTEHRDGWPVVIYVTPHLKHTMGES